jgi:fatty-acyl-CoA synthase/long-chain acyl-CoA synthetase
MAGAVAVPLNARYRLELAHVLRRAEVTVLLANGRPSPGTDLVATLNRCFPDLPGQTDPLRLSLDGAPRLRAVVLVDGGDRPGCVSAAQLPDPGGDPRTSPPPAPDDLACILFTSGTTSTPKGCLLSHRALVQRAVIRARTRLATGAHEVFWSSGPLYHVASSQLLLGCIGVAGTFITSPHFDAAQTIALLRDHPPTSAWPWFPAVIEELLDAPTFDDDVLSTARTLGLVGSPELLRRVQARFPQAELLTSCGMTECGGTYALSARTDTPELRATTMGVPEPGIEVQVRSLGGVRRAAVDEVGELWVRAATIMSGYYGQDDGLDSAGWLHTGDLYARAASGHLSFHGRAKDMLKVGGENVAALEIEALVASHEAVRLVEVVGAPDPRLDEVPVAFVELRPGRSVSPQELIDFCRGKVAAYKVPRAVRFVPAGEWPMSATKVDKRVLREWVTADAETAAP